MWFRRFRKVSLLSALALILLAGTNTIAQTTEFTYQGKLTDGATGANGNYDLEFRLFDVVGGGVPLVTQQRLGVLVTSGIFTVTLDLGANFTGAARFLEIGVKRSADSSFTTLTPRQPITSTPYAIRSATTSTADTAIDATKLGGVAASQYVITTDARLSDARSPTAGSSNYIQNGSSLQAASNFNISGNGTAGGTLAANALTATTNIGIGTTAPTTALHVKNTSVPTIKAESSSNIGTWLQLFNTNAGGRSWNIISSASSNGEGPGKLLFFDQTALATRMMIDTVGKVTVPGELGVGSALNVAGTVNAANEYHLGNQRFLSAGGSQNTFVGFLTGQSNTTGDSNTFAGVWAGNSNTTGSLNTFFGNAAGQLNTDGGSNTFVGQQAGFGNSGSWNSFFGRNAGSSNTGLHNSFFGFTAGEANDASGNSFFGSEAGRKNTTGAANSFFGRQAGNENLTGQFNSFFGSLAGNKNTSGNENSFFGTLAGQDNTQGNDNAFFGYQAGANNTQGSGNTFIGSLVGLGNTTGGFNAFFGTNTGITNMTGDGLALFGSFADVGSNNLTNANAIGNRAYVTQSNSLVLGSIAGVNGSSASTNVGIGTTAPQTALHIKHTSFPTVLTESSSSVGTWLRLLNTSTGGRSWNIISSGSGNGEGAGKLLFHDNASGTTGMTVDSSGNVAVTNTLIVGTLGIAGTTDICLNGPNQISTCSSSLRYKTGVQPFSRGLDIVRRLHPITFAWKDNPAMRDIGLGAEEVNAVEPLLATTNDKGEVEGVKYKQLTTVLVNAVNEQQAQIQTQQEQIKQLKKLVCRAYRRAAVCR